MIMIKTFGEHIDYQDVNPEYEKQFLRHGWVKAPAGFVPNEQTKKTEKLSGHIISPEDYELLMKVKEGKEGNFETHNIPADYDNLKREELIVFAIQKGMKKGEATQSKKEDLITFLKQ